MKASRKAKSAFLTSLISLVLCFSMLLGTTYAWFTDTASTGVNQIVAGTLDVQLLDKDGNSLEGKTMKWKTKDNRDQDKILWEPGCTYELEPFKIKNNGSLALKYKVVINGIVGDAKLLEAIDFTVAGVAGVSTAAGLNGFESNLAANTETGAITIKGHMRDDAGNEYQDLSIDGIAITVYATQLESEFDSFNNSYDHDADYLERHATIKDGGETITLEASKTYTVGNARVEVAANGDITYTNTTGAAQTVTIETDGHNLTVNAPNDTIYHYGESSFVDVNAVAGNSFHEFGKVGVLSVAQGRVVVEKGNNIGVVQVKQPANPAAAAPVIAVPANQVLQTKLEKANGVTEIKLQKGEATAPIITVNVTTGNATVGSGVTVPTELQQVVGATVVTAQDNYVARVGSNVYTTLADAIAAAQNGDTVVLMKNVEQGERITVKDKSLTLDLAGHKITVDDQLTVNGGLILVDNDGDLTINDSSAAKTGMIDVTTNRVNADGQPAVWAAVMIYPDPGYTAKLTVNGGTLKAPYYPISGNGNCTWENATAITINGGKLESTEGLAIYHPQNGTLIVNGGELLGQETAIEIRSGNLTINNGTFTATNKPTSTAPNGNGTTSDGAAIAVAQHTTKLPINVTINGGEFNAYTALYESNPQKNSAEDIAKVHLKVTNGTFNMINGGTVAVYSQDCTGFITGGTFSSDPNAYCANGYGAVKEGNVYKVSKGDFVKNTEELKKAL